MALLKSSLYYNTMVKICNRKFLERNAVFPFGPLLPDDLAELSEHDQDDHAVEDRAVVHGCHCQLVLLLEGVFTGRADCYVV